MFVGTVRKKSNYKINSGDQVQKASVALFNVLSEYTKNQPQNNDIDAYSYRS